MEVFLAVALVSWMFTRAIGDARVDHTYAKQGKVSPRLKAKYGKDARGKVARYGFLHFVRDAWHDYWPRRTEALIAARNAQAANPGERVRTRDRWAAATRVMAVAGRKFIGAVPVKPKTDEQAKPTPAEPAPAPRVVDTGDVPPGTVRYTDAGRERWNGDEWEPITEPTTDDRPSNTSSTPTQEVPAMSGLEASNYETAVPALGELTAAAQNLTDHVAGAKASATQMFDHVNEVDEARRAVEQAATLVMEQLAARNLDADTMGQVTAAMEMIKTGDLTAAMDHIDAAIANLAGAETAAAETSSAAAAAAQTVVTKYGDAANTVASELGGDASFLHSGGGAVGAGSGGPTAPYISESVARHGWTPKNGNGPRQAPAALNGDAKADDNSPARSNLNV